MKYIIKIALLIATMSIAQVSEAREKTPKVTGSETVTAEEAEKLVRRLEEIKAMDRTKMTKSEKRALRKEVKAAEQRLNAGGGVYLSIGAIIIIILLLILLI